MKQYLLPENGSFYKANLHCHTVLSDGNKTPEEVKEAYQKLGYSIVAYTDHELLIPHDELTDENFLALHGFELEINEENKEWKFLKVCHICFIGIEPDNITQPCWHRSKYFFRGNPRHREKVKIDENEPDFERHYDPECITKAMQIGRDKGFFVTYNHPTCLQGHYSRGFDFGLQRRAVLESGYRRPASLRTAAAKRFPRYHPRYTAVKPCSQKTSRASIGFGRYYFQFGFPRTAKNTTRQMLCKKPAYPL